MAHRGKASNGEASRGKAGRARGFDAGPMETGETGDSTPSRGVHQSAGRHSSGGRHRPAPQAPALPDHVANRMVRRAAVLCGVPTAIAMAIFVVSYLLVSKGVALIPPIVTIALSALFFLAGLLGLSYGVLSASWEDAPGSLLGWEHLGTNIGRLRQGARSRKAEP